MSVEPETAMRDFLATAQLGLAVGTNLFEGPERPALGDTVCACVFVMQTGGSGPEDELGSGWSLCRHNVQIRVRGAHQSYAAGRDLARAVLKAAHQATVVGFLGTFALQSDPMYLGEDEQGHHHWSFHVRMDAQEQV